MWFFAYGAMISPRCVRLLRLPSVIPELRVQRAVSGIHDPIGSISIRSFLRDGPDTATSEAAGLGPEPAATAGRRELGRTAAGAGRPVPRGTVPKGVRGVSPVPPRSGAGGLWRGSSPVEEKHPGSRIKSGTTR